MPTHRPLQPRPKTPVPANVSLVPTEEEFAVWCEHPVTRWVAAAYAKGVEANRQAWLAKSWQEARTDDAAAMIAMRNELFTRADTYQAFLETSWADYLNTNNPEAWEEWRKNERA